MFVFGKWAVFEISTNTKNNPPPVWSGWWWLCAQTSCYAAMKSWHVLMIRSQVVGWWLRNPTKAPEMFSQIVHKYWDFCMLLFCVWWIFAAFFSIHIFSKGRLGSGNPKPWNKKQRGGWPWSSRKGWFFFLVKNGRKPGRPEFLREKHLAALMGLCFDDLDDLGMNFIHINPPLPLARWS